MTFDSQKHHRRSIRLKGYDYSQAGAYFITVCVQDRACLFGEVVGGQMHLNDAGRMVLAEWNTLPVRFPGVDLDEFGVMPNHIHGVIVISLGATTRGATTRVAPTPMGMGSNEQTTAGTEPTTVATNATIESPDPVGATLVVAPVVPAPVLPAPGVPPPTLGDIVGAFKSLTTDLYIAGVSQSGWPPFRGRLWLRNYHEHIIRSDESLNRIRQYILDNPANWASDEENPQTERPKKKRA